MFERLGSVIARHPRLTILAWLVITVASLAFAVTGVGGQGLFDRLSSGEPRVAGSESDEARDLLIEHATTGPSLSLVVQGVDLADPAEVAAAGAATATLHTQLLATEGVESVVDPFVFPAGPADPQALPFVSAAADGFVVNVTLQPDLDPAVEGAAHAAVVAQLRALAPEIGGDATGIVSGSSLIGDAIVSQIEQDLATGEIVALPISLLIMVFVFGGFLAAGMPLAGALASIAGGLGILLGFSYMIDLDSVVVNVVTVMGLGLSIDYGLLIVSRYREEIRAAVQAEGGPDLGAGSARRERRTGVDPTVHRAMRRTMTTAGRTITFSAVTVAISIAGLLLLKPDILRSLGAAGVSVVVLAVASALTLVPALLALRGRRLLRPSLLSRIPGLRTLLAKFGDVPPEHGFFSRLAGAVQRRAWIVLVAVTAILLLLASPLLSLQLRNSTTELLPSSSDQRDFIAIMQADYPQLTAAPIGLLVEGTEAPADLVAAITALPGVLAVDPPQPLGDGFVRIGIRPDTTDAGGPEATELVRDIRDLRTPDTQFWVFGQAANQIDFNAALLAGLPWALGVVVLATFVLLFLMTGSLLVPLKALLINVLSLAASLGVTTWIFQDGHFADLLSFTSAGGLESYVVAVVVAFGFGLAMDYEVFLIARIKEHYDADQDNDAAVRRGLQKSGRIITSAAIVIMVVFAGFVAGELLVIKEVGVALALTVLIDATLVRMLLVPATMTLLGHQNWWAPAPLRTIYRRFAIQH